MPYSLLQVPNLGLGMQTDRHKAFDLSQPCSSAVSCLLATTVNKAAVQVPVHVHEQTRAHRFMTKYLLTTVKFPIEVRQPSHVPGHTSFSARSCSRCALTFAPRARKDQATCMPDSSTAESCSRFTAGPWRAEPNSPPVTNRLQVSVRTLGASIRRPLIRECLNLVRSNTDNADG